MSQETGIPFFFFGARILPLLTTRKITPKLPSFRKIVFINFQNVRLFHFAQITLPNIRDKFKGILNHPEQDLTLSSRDLTHCKSARRIRIPASSCVIPFRTRRTRFQYNILISRSHPSLQHEGRTSILLHVSSVRSARLSLFPPGQRFRELFGTAFHPRGLHPLAAL